MRLIITALLAFTLVSCHSQQSKRSEAVLQMLGSEQNLETIRNPDYVEITALNIEGDIREYRKIGRPLLTAKEYQPLRVGPTRLSDHSQQSLSRALASEKSYIWEGAKGCLPFFHLSASFHRGSEIVVADFCFGCDIVDFWKDDTWLGGEDFDNVSDNLLMLFLEVFPTNSILRQVANERSEK